MQAVYKGNVYHKGKYETILMTLIDLDPNDIWCIYGTKIKIGNEKAREKTALPFFTFDQPLFWKATTIADNEKDDPEIKAAIIKIRGLVSGNQLPL